MIPVINQGSKIIGMVKHKHDLVLIITVLRAVPFDERVEKQDPISTSCNSGYNHGKCNKTLINEICSGSYSNS